MQEAISFTPQFGPSAIAWILWLIPAVPMLASGVIALLKQPKRKPPPRSLSARSASHCFWRSSPSPTS